jgi:hypothetical protein
MLIGKHISSFRLISGINVWKAPRHQRFLQYPRTPALRWVVRNLNQRRGGEQYLASKRLTEAYEILYWLRVFLASGHSSAPGTHSTLSLARFPGCDPIILNEWAAESGPPPLSMVCTVHMHIRAMRLLPSYHKLSCFLVAFARLNSNLQRFLLPS